MTTLANGRLVGWAGIIFSVLSLVVIPMSPELPPHMGSTPQRIAEYFNEHRMGFLVGNYIGVAAFFPGLIQLAFFTMQVRRRETADGYLGALILAAGVVAYSVGAIVLILLQVLPFVADPGAGSGLDAAQSGAVLVAVAAIANVCFALFLLATVPYLWSAAWATLETKVFPRWFAGVSIAVSLVNIVASFGAIWTSPAWLAAGGLASNMGFVAFFSWTFVLALLHLRTPKS